MKLGSERKKVAILGGLLAAAGVIFYFNEFSGDSGSGETPRVAVTASTPLAAPIPAPTTRSTASGISRDDRRRSKNNLAVSEFSFRQGQEPGEEKPDLSTIDPTLRLDLLAKVQQVEAPSALRNIFQYGAAPPPPASKPIPLPEHPPLIPISRPAPQPGGPPAPPPQPQAPPMTFKYYGYKVSKADGRKEAFLLDGDDIIIAAENDSMKAGRYRIVRIGVSSITIEDTQFKASQTLQLQPDSNV